MSKNDDLTEAIRKGDVTAAAALLDDDRSLLHAAAGPVSAILLAVYHGRRDIAQLFLDRGADVNAASRNAQRVAPVHAAATIGDAASLRLLLERGADPNARQHLGYAPLHSAAANDDRATSEILLAHGADPHAKTDDGKTPADLATERGHGELADWLRGQPDHPTTP